MVKIFICITILAFVLRVYQIDEVPPGLSNDEISIAYNAYSILRTGKDEYGNFLPLSFRSHNTYKAPLYIYLTVPFLKIFGNSELAVRLPSVVFGSLTVLSLMLLVQLVFKNRLLSFIAGFSLAITPWHIYTSRIALESNIGLFFFVVGVFLFNLFLFKKKLKWLLFGSLAFGLSMYGYHTEWIFTPTFFIGILIWGLFQKKLSVKNFVWGIGLFLILCLPLIFDYLTNLQTNARANTEFITNDFRLHSQIQNGHGDWLSNFVITARFIFQSYLSYFDLTFLFFNGLPVPNENSLQRIGLLNLICLPFFLIGLLNLKKLKKPGQLMIIVWLLLAPVVPALTLGGTNLVRNLLSVIPITIIVSWGIYVVMIRFPQKFVWSLLSLGLFFNLILVGHSYFIHFPIESSENWSYGFKQMAQNIDQNGYKYQKIVIDPAYGSVGNNLVGVPSLFLLFFNNYDPQVYLDTKIDQPGFLKFDKFEIRRVDWPKEKPMTGELYIAGVNNYPSPLHPVHEVYSIKLLNGKRGFDFYEGYQDVYQELKK